MKNYRENSRKQFVGFRLEDHERAALEQAALRQGATLSEFLRRMIAELAQQPAQLGQQKNRLAAA